jgi:hypothetical protein
VSRHVTTSVIGVTEFQELAEFYRVTGVPKVVVNGDVEILGFESEKNFVQKVCGVFE